MLVPVLLPAAELGLGVLVVLAVLVHVLESELDLLLVVLALLAVLVVRSP